MSFRYEFLELVRAAKRVSSAFDRELVADEVTLTQSEALLAMSLGGATRHQDLANLLKVNKASLVPMLDRLEARGWIERMSNPSDERSTLISLTNSGVQKVKSVQKSLQRISEKFRAEISNQDLEHLVQTLRKISKNLPEGNKE